jgi:GTP-binding protein
MAKLVSIVGRPNVGKSTLFNRLTESNAAIVDPTSGVTRDRKYGTVQWGDRDFNVIDTGGYLKYSSQAFDAAIRSQVEISVEESDLILFVVDSLTGISEDDEQIAKMLRRSDKPVILVSNKVDTGDKEFQSTEFYSLGIDSEIYSISANNGYGTGDLLDEIMVQLPKEPVKEEDDLPKIAVVGRPNVGKSSLINNLVGEDRAIVTDIAGTTRDSVNSRYSAFGFDFIITDTAGLRKKSKIHENLEFYSTVRTIKAIDQSDVCLLLIDAEDGVQKQDLNIFYYIHQRNKGVVVLVNKWDKVEKDQSTYTSVEKTILQKFEPYTDIPLVFTSNVTKQRIHKALETALEVYEARKTKIPTSKLNNVMLEVINHNPPPAVKGKYIRIKYVTQLPSSAPVFAFFCNLPQYVKEPYRRYLENQLRKNFNFKGVPLRLFFRKK